MTLGNKTFFLKLLENEGLEPVMGGAEVTEREPPTVSTPEEKRPSLTLEELEAKQGMQITHTVYDTAAIYLLFKATLLQKEIKDHLRCGI